MSSCHYGYILGLLTLTKRLEDEGEPDESEEEGIEFPVARKNAVIALQPTEQTLDFVAPLVGLVVIVPGGPLGPEGGGTTGVNPSARASSRVWLSW